MRNKFFDKLSKYKEESQKNNGSVEARMSFNEKDNVCEGSEKNRSAAVRKSNKTLHVLDSKKYRSTNNSQLLPVFTRKIATSRTNYFEINPRSYTPGFV